MKKKLAYLLMFTTSLFIYTGCSKKEDASVLPVAETELTAKALEEQMQKLNNSPWYLELLKKDGLTLDQRMHNPKSNSSARYVNGMTYYLSEYGDVSLPASTGYQKQMTLTVINNTGAVQMYPAFQIIRTYGNSCNKLKSIDFTNGNTPNTGVNSNGQEYISWLPGTYFGVRLRPNEIRTLKFTIVGTGSCVEGSWSVYYFPYAPNGNTVAPDQTDDYAMFINNVNQ